MMRRPIAIVAGLTALAMLPACSGSSTPAKVQQKLSDTFQVGMTLETDDFMAEGTLTRCGDGVWQVYFDSPSEIAGVQLDFSGDDVAASYKGLAFSVPQAAMPSKAVLLHLIQAVDELAENEEISGKKKDGCIEIEGEHETGAYVLCLGADGSLSEFRMDNMGALITFHDFNGGVQITTTVTTIESLVITTTGSAAETTVQAQ